MGKATGLGGAFLKAKDPKSLYAWYEKHLGIERSEHGSFEFSKADVTSSTIFALFAENTSYFGAGAQRTMLNFRVDDLDGLLDAMLAEGVDVDPNREAYDFGKFGWFTDPEGNRVELWQPLEPARDTSPSPGSGG